jgi:H+/Cl- antiporter ClcA
MWFENIWNTPLFWWLLLAGFGGGLIILVLLWRRTKPDPVKEQMDHVCRCYARGELSREDFEELKKDLQEYKKQINPTTPPVRTGKNDN